MGQPPSRRGGLHEIDMVDLVESTYFGIARPHGARQE
jgi:hypothetical protein